MICKTCGNQEAWHVVSAFDTQADSIVDCCDACGLEGAGAGVPDVYLARTGQTFANLCDETGRPYEITSKRHKKEVMDRLGVSEAGDRMNGAPFGTKSWVEGSRAWRKKQFDKDRPAIREMYRRYLENARPK